MTEHKPITMALHRFFGPLVEQSAKLPAPLAYGSALALAILVIALLGATIPDNLVWLLGAIILTSLAAFVFTDWDARRRMEGAARVDLSTENELAPQSSSVFDVRYERKIEEVLRELVQLHTRYDLGRGEIIPLGHLLSALRPLFNRKTFHEPFPECVDENWQDRLCAVIQIEHILSKNRIFAKAAASFEQDERALLAYEEMQRELGRYSQDMTGLFQPPPQVADLEASFLAGNLDGVRMELQERAIHPKNAISTNVLEGCETHRKHIIQQVRSWPAIPAKGAKKAAPSIAFEAEKPAKSAETPPSDVTKLHAALEDLFSLEELRTLCFDLSVDYDSLPGEGKSAKARELIAYLVRRNELDSLIAVVRRERGDAI